MSETPRVELSFDRLALLVSRAWCAPVLPNTVNQVSRVLSSPSPRPSQVEPILSVDPGLVALTLRSANLKSQGIQQAPITRIPWALINLDIKGIRDVLSKSRLQQLTANPGSASGSKRVFDLVRFTRHSAISATLARALFRRWRNHGSNTSVLSPDEVYAVTLLLEFGRMMFARVAPAEYVAFETKARESGQTADTVFRAETGGSLAALTALSLRAMHLPDLFSDAILAVKGFSEVEQVAEADSDSDLSYERPLEEPVIQIIAYASQFADSVGVSLDPWAPQQEPQCAVLEDIGLGSEQVRGLVKASVVAVAPYLPRDRRRRATALIEPRAA